MVSEYCFLWIHWWATCMTKAEWATWMQAIGSVLALGIAVWIPIALRTQDMRQRKSAALTAAEIVIAGIRVTLEPTVGLLSAIQSQLNQEIGGNFSEAHVTTSLEIFQGLPYPNEAQLHKVGIFFLDVAHVLVRASNRQIQCALLFQTLKAQYRFDISPSEGQKTLTKQIVAACLLDFKMAQEVLEKIP